MSGNEADQIECRLCRKKKETSILSHRSEISQWTKVCSDCIAIWELGKKAQKATKADGKESEARVPQTIPYSVKLGTPDGVTEVKGLDVIAAMGAISLRGTEMGSMFGGAEHKIDIVTGADQSDWVYIGGQTLKMKVPEARAGAMRRIVSAFLNMVAKARVEGFNEGRNLLAGLARGTVSLDDYTEQADNARLGKKPKKRWD